MTLNLTIPEHEELKPRITVFGVGGAGGNAVNNMIEKQLDGVEFVVANTDAQALQQNKAASRVQLGVKATEGLGAGARPAIGAAAAEESIEQIIDYLAGSHMCFITAGMGGGTGTGATPIIAQAARELGVLTVGVVTKPFQFEGAKRMRQAEEGVEALQKMVDTLIIIPNQNLFRLANEKTTFTEAFSMADDVLYQGVKGVTDLMVRPGLINLDFADVRAVMDEMGKAMMGTGEGTGEDRAVQAAEKAIANPLLDEISLKGARGVLINITGGYDLTLFELDEAANRIREEVDPDANIIVGSTLDPDLSGEMRVSVVATGIEAEMSTNDIPLPRRFTTETVDKEISDAQNVAAVQEQEENEKEHSAVGTPQSVDSSETPLFDHVTSNGDEQFVDAMESNDLPPPAYTAPEEEDSFDSFIAAVAEEQQQYTAEPKFTPSAATEHKVNTPSQETLDRLYAAAAKQPKGDQTRTAHLQGAGERSSQNVDRPRFGINSLINRMTGHHEERTRTAPPSIERRSPNIGEEAVQPPHAEATDEEERIEVPAFLRRQAN